MTPALLLDPASTVVLCQRRAWLETDEHMASGPICGEVAQWLSCTPIVDQPVCERHRCRCRKPLTPEMMASLRARGLL